MPPSHRTTELMYAVQCVVAGSLSDNFSDLINSNSPPPPIPTYIYMAGFSKVYTVICIIFVCKYFMLEIFV